MSVVYINKIFLNEKDAHISIYDRGFLFGDGFFETIRCQNGTILFLKDHLDRLCRSCEEFKITLPRMDKMGAIIKRLLVENKLNTSVAAAKIIITRGITGELMVTATKTPTIIVTVRPYRSFPESLYTSGLSLVVFPYPHQTFLAKHKSLNYLYYISAFSFAKQKKAHDAIIMDHKGNVLEGAISNLMICRASAIIAPPSSMDLLPGVTQKYALAFFEKKGFKILYKPIKLKDLFTADEIIVTNSLFLSAPVRKVEGTPVSKDSYCGRLLKDYFQSKFSCDSP
ncbi:MAG: aminotransferase class IV [bacterium]